jgi:hypothetical protein
MYACMYMCYFELSCLMIEMDNKCKVSMLFYMFLYWQSWIIGFELMHLQLQPSNL